MIELYKLENIKSILRYWYIILKFGINGVTYFLKMIPIQHLISNMLKVTLQKKKQY